MITEEEYRKAMDIVIKYRDQLAMKQKEIDTALKLKPKFYNVTKETEIDRSILTIRAINCLKYVIDYKKNIFVYQLEQLDRKKLSSYRGFGKSVVTEVTELMDHVGI